MDITNGTGEMKLGLIIMRKEIGFTQGGVLEPNIGMMKKGIVFTQGMAADESVGWTMMDIGKPENLKIGNMKKTHNKLTCLFGHHDYSKELTKDNRGRLIHLCKICKRSGYRKWIDSEVWATYNERGTRIYEKWIKEWGSEKKWWKANNGSWVDKKPKNWKYEKQI